MKGKKKRNLQKALVVIFTALFTIMLFATGIAYENKSTLTNYFGIPDFITVESDAGENVDKEYFKSDYKNIRELVYGGYLIQLEEQTEGTVLLKNDNNALPLTKGAKVSVFGSASTTPQYSCSPGSGVMSTHDKIDWFDAFAGKYYEPATPKDLSTPDSPLLNVNPDLTSANATWAEVTANPGYAKLAEYGEAAIVILGRTGAEGSDLLSSGAEGHVNGDYLQLTTDEVALLEGLKQEKEAGNIKKIVLILNMSSPLQLDFLKNDTYGIDACVWAGAVGEFGTSAVVKLLIGEANFSAGNSLTMWVDNLQNPVNANTPDKNYEFVYDNYTNFGFEENQKQTYGSYVVYQEGMYLGYKYTETRYEDYVMGTPNVGEFKYDEVVAYPFGYGLSYTTFEFSNLQIAKNGKTYEVKVDVTNTGSVAGKTPVQVYIAKPYGDYERQNQIQVPSVQLIDFGKTGVIAAGAKETITINVDEKYFSTFDTFGAGTYVLTPGEYRLIVARDAHQAVNNLLAAKGYSPQNTNGRMDAAGNADLVKSYTYELDTKAYSLSSETSNPITRAFDFADINLYEGRGDNKVTYYSRDNWEGTVALSTRINGVLYKPHASLVMTQTMADTLKDQADAGKVIKPDDTPYPTYGADNGLVLLDLMHIDEETGEITYEPYDSIMWDKLLDQMTWLETVQLLSNGRHQTYAIESIAKPGAGDENGPNGFNQTYENDLVAGGRYAGPHDPYARRVGDPDAGQGYSSTGLSSNGVLAASFNKELAAKIGKQLGEEGLWSGVSGLLGTGLNIQRTTYSGRTAEYYSEDAMLTGLIAAPQTAATEAMGVHCFIKHCAMNEIETARCGLQIWVSEQAMRENYFRAFEIVIEEGNSFNVMTSFSRIGVWAVANSVDFTQEFLRKECGLPGIVETDFAGSMTNSGYVSRIVNVYTGATDLNEANYGDDDPDRAGSSYTYASFAPTSAGGPGGYGKLGQAMRESAKRILYASISTNMLNGHSSNSRIEKIMVPWEIAIIAADVILGILCVASIAWVVTDVVKSKKKVK